MVTISIVVNAQTHQMAKKYLINISKLCREAITKEVNERLHGKSENIEERLIRQAQVLQQYLLKAEDAYDLLNERYQELRSNVRIQEAKDKRRTKDGQNIRDSDGFRPSTIRID